MIFCQRASDFLRDGIQLHAHIEESGQLNKKSDNKQKKKNQNEDKEAEGQNKKDKQSKDAELKRYRPP